MTRPVWVEVNHQAIRENYRKIRNYVNPGASICGVVKADAYGHGAVEVAHTLVQQGIDRLAVAMPEEATPLRKSGLTLPIHVFGEVLPQQYPLLEQLRLTQTVGSAETLQLLSDFAVSWDSEISIHLKCDTGMGRLGPLPDETADFVQYARNLPGLRLEGLMTHLARGDEQDGEYSRFQWNVFQEIMQDLHQRGIRLPLYHIANSPGLCLFPEMHLDMVRPGIMLYGMLPSLSFAPPFQLQPALSWKARIVNLKILPEKHGVSYSTVYFTKNTEKLAIIPAGYADGYSRSLSNKAEVLVHGRRVPVRGRICMDQFMVDVSQVPGVAVGDEVVLLGRQHDEEITAHELAATANTLNYDITCSISSRVPVRHVRYHP